MQIKGREVSVGNILTILAMAGSLGAVYADSSAENAKQKERVDNLKEQTKEIKIDVKETNSNVQKILLKLEAMEAARAAEAKAARIRQR